MYRNQEKVNYAAMMQNRIATPSTENNRRELLYFWAFGDLHYRDHRKWQLLHRPRMETMFEDVRRVWQAEGQPAFCVSPGDIVNSGGEQNYALARRELAAQLGDIPFYPGIGNHEYAPNGDQDAPHSASEFSLAWGKPTRYTWLAGDIACIMLDQPDPYLPGQRRENPHVVLSGETLAYLDAALTKHAARLAIIFAHCPLWNTVLDRDPARNLDDDSLDTFFFVENSADVRAILARHPNAALYITGHTHSGWDSPQLVFTEMLGGHPVTHLNLMSPWYTGHGHGPYRPDPETLIYRPDDPDVQVSFAVRVYPRFTVIRARDHRARAWIGEWRVPLYG